MTPERTKYLRQYRRDKNGRPWLNDLEEMAINRGLILRQIIDVLLEEIVRLRMVDKILDGHPRAKSEAGKGRGR